MFAEGDRAGWLNAIAAQIMDGGTSPPSIDRLNITVPPKMVTRDSDGHCTAAAAFGEKARNDKEAGWRVIIDEMVTALREQGFVGGSDQGLTWIEKLDGEWKVIIPGAQITVFGQLQRRMTRDRAVIGERDENDGDRVGVPSLLETGRGHPFKLQVIGPRGGTTEQSFELHPLAIAIPPMTAAERETLRKSIERDGVKMPIEIYQKKILDGRNRAYFAFVFNKPVQIKIFEGTEDQARRHVAILNLHRRHLNTAQRYLAAYNLFGEQAEKEAAVALDNGRIRGGYSSPLFLAESKRPDRSGEWNARAAYMAVEAGIANITPAGMRAIREVRDAPQTKARIESGEITRVAEANAAARIEKGLAPSIRTEGIEVISINKRLGRCIELLNTILTDCDIPSGTAPGEQISLRLTQIETLAGQVREALRQRRIIS